MEIVVIGAIFVDIKGFPLNHYIPTGRNAGTIEYVHGGVSRNVAEDIANVGVHSTLLSIVDESALGKDVLAHLEKRKVNTSYIQTIPQGMGTWLAVFDEKGDVAGSISQRPNLYPLYDLLLEKGDEIISHCDSVVLEADIDFEIMERVFSLSKLYNKKVFSIISNMGIAIERKHLLHQFDCFICNDIEAGQLFQLDLSICNPIQIIEKKQELNIKNLIITLGENGCMTINENNELSFLPANKVHVVDTTGAGDAFCAGVAIGLTDKKNLNQSAKIGTQLASFVIQSNQNTCPIGKLNYFEK